jgi:ketopantoate reductase
MKQAGQDVCLLARGNCQVNLRQNSIRLQNMLTGQQENVQINLVERLAPQDAYDLVIVVMGKHQVPAVLSALAANIATSSVVLIGHNAAGPPEITAALGNERSLLGFYDAGRIIRQGVVYCGDGVGKRKGRVTFGELCG